MAVLDSDTFANQIRETVAAKRAFREHPWMHRLFRAELTKRQIARWLEQLYCITGTVHPIIGPIYSNCSIPELRKAILKNLMEEETGSDSKTAPHPELYVRCGRALGTTREEMERVRPLPDTEALRTWWMWLANNRPAIEALAAMSIAGESQVPEAADRVARVLEENYGLTHEDAAFFWVHGEADKEHGGGAVELVAKLARSEEEQDLVRRRVETGLHLWWRVFDGVEQAFGNA